MPTNVRRPFRPVFRLWWVLGALACATGPDAPGPVRILFIGNSLTYTNDLPGMVEALADSAGLGPVVVRQVTYPDYSLEDHWNRGDALAAIRQGDWKFVVMQQGPSIFRLNPSAVYAAPIDQTRDHLLLWASRFGDEIRQQQGIPVLYMVWPEYSARAMMPEVYQSYRLAADSAGGLFAPAGQAWSAAWARDSSLVLYAPDNGHPAPEGSLLAALTIFGVIFDRSPIGLPAGLRTRDGFTLQVSAARARLLQEAAAAAITGAGP